MAAACGGTRGVLSDGTHRSCGLRHSQCRPCQAHTRSLQSGLPDHHCNKHSHLPARSHGAHRHREACVAGQPPERPQGPAGPRGLRRAVGRHPAVARHAPHDQHQHGHQLQPDLGACDAQQPAQPGSRQAGAGGTGEGRTSRAWLRSAARSMLRTAVTRCRPAGKGKPGKGVPPNAGEGPPRAPLDQEPVGGHRTD